MFTLPRFHSFQCNEFMFQMISKNLFDLKWGEIQKTIFTNVMFFVSACKQKTLFWKMQNLTCTVKQDTTNLV